MIIALNIPNVFPRPSHAVNVRPSGHGGSGGSGGGVFAGGAVLETEDGNVLETEDGNSIKLEQ